MLVVIVEAEHAWNQSSAAGMGHENRNAWKPVQNPHMIGHVLQAPSSDHQLLFRHYRKVREIEDHPGLIGLGPDMRLPIGHYKTTWWLAGMPMRAAPNDVVATVSVDVHKQRIVARDVTAGELAHAHGAPFPVVLTLALAEFADHLNFVTWYAGRGEVDFLRTECERVG